MVKIAVIDDEAPIRDLISLYLLDEQYSVIEFENGKDALEYIEKNEMFDLAVVDIMMPKVDGYTFVRKIREFSEIPIIMLTAKESTHDRIKGFQAGTDDYVIKPFDPTELVYRVKSLLKRVGMYSSSILNLGLIQLNRIKFEVIFPDGHKEMIPLKEFELLFTLGSHPGQVYTREMLIEKIWGIEFNGIDRTVDVHIRKLRERFEPFEDNFKITTLRGVGYRLEVFHA